MPKKDTAKIIEMLGVKNSRFLFSQIGVTRTFAFWRNYRAHKIIEMIDSVGIEEAAYIAKKIPFHDVKKWIRRKGVKGMPMLIEHIGVENLVKIHSILGIDKCIKLSNALSPEEMIILSRELKSISYPRLTRKRTQEIRKFREEIKRRKKLKVRTKSPGRRSVKTAGRSIRKKSLKKAAVKKRK